MDINLLPVDRWAVSVSYTHLDVYKRQILGQHTVIFYALSQHVIYEISRNQGPGAFLTYCLRCMNFIH